MKVKQRVLKDNISITFTPDEIWELIVICEGSKVFNHNNMQQHLEGGKAHGDYKRLYDQAEKMQQKIIEIRNTHSVLEEQDV